MPVLVIPERMTTHGFVFTTPQGQLVETVFNVTEPVAPRELKLALLVESVKPQDTVSHAVGPIIPATLALYFPA